MRIVVGVVPFTRDSIPADDARISLPADKVATLADYASRGVVEIAVHGYRHVDRALRVEKSEFAGVPIDDQGRWLRHAKTAVEVAVGEDVQTFVPPWNRHDEHTIAALARAGYAVLSSADLQPAIAHKRVSYLPGTVYPQEFARVVENLRENDQCEGIVTVVSHPYDFQERSNLPGFRKGKAMPARKFVRQLKKLRDAGSIAVVGIEDLQKRHEDLGYRRYRLNQSLRYGVIERLRLLPERLGLYAQEGIYYSARDAARLLWTRRLLAAAIYGLILSVAISFTARLVRRNLIKSSLIPMTALITSGAAVALFGFSTGELGAKVAALAALIAGSAIGLLLAKIGPIRERVALPPLKW